MNAPKPRKFIVRRDRLALTLAAPYALLFCASLTTWVWRALSLPGIAGAIAPPAIFLLAVTAGLGMFALRRGLPLGMLTWTPAALGGLIILGTGFITSSEDVALGAGVLIAYVVFFLITAGLATVLARHGMPLALSFVAFFILSQVTRFPVFEAEATSTVPFPTLLTAAAAAIALAEIALLVWFADALVHAAAPDDDPDPADTGLANKSWAPTLSLLGLIAAHGLVAAWEDPAMAGTLSFSQMLDQAARWWALAAIQIGLGFAFIRVGRSWGQEPSPEQPEVATEAVATAQPLQPEPASGTSRAPRRRSRRRR